MSVPEPPVVDEDPIVAEVRRVREEHAARFGYDLQAIFADLKRSEQAQAAPEGRQHGRGATAPTQGGVDLVLKRDWKPASW